MHTLRQAVFPGDAGAVRAIFDAYVGFLTERAPPEVVAPILSKYPVDRRADAVDEFAEIHVPPRGALLLAERTGGVMGCGMMRRLSPDSAELQRVYVRPEARGTGLGRAITQALIETAAQGGARTIRLDTGGPLTEAIGLYTALGFREVPPYHDEHPALQPHLLFFELTLPADAPTRLP